MKIILLILGLVTSLASAQSTNDYLFYKWNGTAFVKEYKTTFPAASHDHAFSSLTSKPTTLSCYGSTSLAHHLRMEMPSPLSPVWPEPFHIDEIFLAAWWRSAMPWLDVMIYVDRVQHPRFWRECHATIEHGRKLLSEGWKTDDGPMWRSPL